MQWMQLSVITFQRPIDYCYHPVNVITSNPGQSDHIKRLLLYFDNARTKNVGLHRKEKKSCIALWKNCEIIFFMKMNLVMSFSRGMLSLPPTVHWNYIKDALKCYKNEKSHLFNTIRRWGKNLNFEDPTINQKSTATVREL